MLADQSVVVTMTMTTKCALRHFDGLLNATCSLTTTASAWVMSLGRAEQKVRRTPHTLNVIHCWVWLCGNPFRPATGCSAYPRRKRDDLPLAKPTTTHTKYPLAQNASGFCTSRTPGTPSDTNKTLIFFLVDIGVTPWLASSISFRSDMRVHSRRVFALCFLVFHCVMSPIVVCVFGLVWFGGAFCHGCFVVALGRRHCNSTMEPRDLLLSYGGTSLHDDDQSTAKRFGMLVSQIHPFRRRSVLAYNKLCCYAAAWKMP